MCTVTGLDRGREELLAFLVVQNVRKCLEDLEHRKEFEEWYLKTYGQPYIWKKEVITD